MAGTVRPLIGGGCSICLAAEENIGKRKCRHMTGATIEVQREHNVSLINIEGTVDDHQEKLTIIAADKQIREYITSLSSSLTKEEKDELLTALR